MKRIFYTLLLVSAMSATNYSFAQQKEKPTYVTQVEEIKEYKLSNGLQVLLIPDATQNNLAVNIVYKVGSKHEGYGEKGMAHLLEHMLFKSTKNLGDIKKLISDKGGNANGTTWYDRTNYYEIFPSSDENLAWALQMEAERMIYATIKQEDLDKEFSVVRNEFEIGENNPNRVLMERTINTAYLWHNYGLSTIGSKEDIERVKTPQLKRFYEKYYQPDNAVLIVAGNFNEKSALNYIEQYFSVIPKPTRVLDEILTVEPAQDGEKYVEVKRAGDSQHINALYHTASYADKDYAALAALRHILINDPSGYLYKSLVATKKATSLSAMSPTVRDASFMLFSFNIPSQNNLQNTLVDVKNELNKISQNTYTQEDLDRAKTNILKGYENMKNNTIGLAINLTEIVGAGDYRLGMIFRDNVENLTLNDINQVAKKYFKENNRTVGLFIPSKDETRVKPNELLDSDITKLVTSYKGKEQGESLRPFEASIANLEKHFTHGQLSNGLKYGFIDKDIKGEKVSIFLSLPIGNEKDLQNKSYIGTFTANLMTAGTKNLSKQEIKDKLDQLKSNVSFRFGEQTLSVSISTYRNTLEETMSIVNELINNPIFPEDELVKLQAQYKSYLESNLNDPQALASIELEKATSNYPKGSIYYASSIQEDLDGYAAITVKDLQSFYNNFLGANNGVVSVIGANDLEKVKSLLDNTFGKWNSKAKYEKAKPTYFATKEAKKIIETPDKENAAAMGAISFEMNNQDADYPALVFANEILGGGGFMTARVPQRLREKEGISYGAGTYVSVPTDPKNNVSSFGFYAFLNPTKRLDVENAMNDELSKIISKGVTEEEMTNNKIGWKNSRQTNLGNDGYLMSLSNDFLMYNIPFNEFEKLNSQIEKLTVKQVNDAVKKYIVPSKMTTIYAGDFNKK